MGRLGPFGPGEEMVAAGPLSGCTAHFGPDARPRGEGAPESEARRLRGPGTAPSPRLREGPRPWTAARAPPASALQRRTLWAASAERRTRQGGGLSHEARGGAERSGAGPSRAEPSRAEPSRGRPGQAGHYCTHECKRDPKRQGAIANLPTRGDQGD